MINCKSGQRARYAYSVLANKGIQAHILVDSNYKFNYRILIIIGKRP